MAPPRPRSVRIPGTARVPEGEARKVLVPNPDPGRPPLELLLVRLDGRLFALDSLCPHEGGRLAEGPLWDGCWVSCPLHLYRFDPCTGAAAEVECDSARVFTVREDASGAVVEVDEGDPGD
jgi:nitrite reductase/ring-hydroxylating ferredoxin subunit